MNFLHIFLSIVKFLYKFDMILPNFVKLSIEFYPLNEFFGSSESSLLSFVGTGISLCSSSGGLGNFICKYTVETCNEN